MNHPYTVLSMYIVVYQVFVSLCGHGKWVVHDLKCLILERFKHYSGCTCPLLSLNHRSDGTALVCWVQHRQGLSVRATHWANKIHRLETRSRKDELFIRQHDVAFPQKCQSGTEKVLVNSVGYNSTDTMSLNVSKCICTSHLTAFVQTPMTNLFVGCCYDTGACHSQGYR